MVASQPVQAAGAHEVSLAIPEPASEAEADTNKQLRDEIMKLERSRRRFQLQAEQRESDLQQEVAQLKAQIRQLMERAESPSFGLERPLRLAEENLRLADENRLLNQERKHLLEKLAQAAQYSQEPSMQEVQEKSRVMCSSRARSEASVQTDTCEMMSESVATQSSCEVVATSVQTDAPSAACKHTANDEVAFTNISLTLLGSANEFSEAVNKSQTRTEGLDAGEAVDVRRMRSDLQEMRQECARLTQEKEDLVREVVQRPVLSLQDLHTEEQQAAAALDRARAEAYQSEMRGLLCQLRQLASKPSLSPPQDGPAPKAPVLQHGLAAEKDEQVALLSHTAAPPEDPFEGKNQHQAQRDEEEAAAGVQESSVMDFRPPFRVAAEDADPGDVDTAVPDKVPAHGRSIRRLSVFLKSDSSQTLSGRAEEGELVETEAEKSSSETKLATTDPDEPNMSSERTDSACDQLRQEVGELEVEQQRLRTMRSELEAHAGESLRTLSDFLRPSADDGSEQPVSEDESWKIQVSTPEAGSSVKALSALNLHPNKVDIAALEGHCRGLGSPERNRDMNASEDDRSGNASPASGGKRASRASVASGASVDSEWQYRLTPRPSLARLHPQSTLASLGSGRQSPERPHANATSEHQTLDLTTTSMSLVQEGRQLFEAFFVIGQEAEGVCNSARLRWPASLEGGGLEKVLITDTFCPGPLDERFEGMPFAFTLLETAVDPKNDPNGVLYCCVCSENADMPSDPGEPTPGEEPAAKRSKASPRENCMSSAGGVLCLVSKLPLLPFFFKLLSVLRCNLDQACAVLARLNQAGLKSLAEGVEISDLVHVEDKLGLQQMPESRLPPECDWQDIQQGNLADPFSKTCQSIARWQVAWGLSTMLRRWEGLPEVVVKLLPCVLLEQKILLVGDAQRVSTVAMLLRGLLWPFRWLHLFLAAPPPSGVLKVPLLDGPCPMILSVSELPPHWGKSHLHLPADVIVVMVKHDHVQVNPHLETAGGLKGDSIKLPGTMHVEFRKQVTQARLQLRNSKILISEAVEKVQIASEAVMQKFHAIVKSYAKSRLDASSEAVTDESPQDRCERCFRQSIDAEVVMSWLSKQDASCRNPDSNGFYTSFFQTQLFFDMLHEEISRQGGS
eukprot:TRINITY_DN37876_c0_g1_i1.p1 TRINITY_DN37876_c0_g1~~TRINITY_DN37876_c0_g1_i1.p1  ORF type:complete len:1155 (-),score=261.50 TRINITY_DN37876_c0_g1_i1:147-3551(-)